MTRAGLHQRLALASLIAGAGLISWRAAEAAAALAPPLFLVSGIGLGVFIVGAILLLGAAMQGRTSRGLDILADPEARPVMTKALYAGVATTFIAAGFAVLTVTLGGGPAAPVELILALGAGASLLVFGWGHARLARS